MKNINIGIVNLIITEKLKKGYYDNQLLAESDGLTSSFFDVINSSPILQLEFKVFNNIENKHIEKEILATRYIDNNIKLFEVYTIDEIEKERGKLKRFLVNENIPTNNEKVKLFNAIDNLIEESISAYDKIDVDILHESFEHVLNHIRTPKEVKIENNDSEQINEDVLEIAVKKFNEKYQILTDEDKKLFETLVKSNDTEKEELLENFKSENLKLLEGAMNDKVKENILKAMQKIKEMKYNKNTADNDILRLYELKKEIL